MTRHDEVVRIVNCDLPSNTYLVPVADGRCAVVDPGLDRDALERELGARSLTPVAVLCTHGHFDHIASAHDLQQRHGAKIYLHSGDVALTRKANFLMMACKIDRRIVIPAVDVEVSDGSSVAIGDAEAVFHHTPGHTPGSCMIAVGELLFTGDSLYRDGVGLVQFPGEDVAQLRASLRARWDELEDGLWAFPGHGGNGALGEIKRRNDALLDLVGLGEEAA